MVDESWIVPRAVYVISAEAHTAHNTKRVRVICRINHRPGVLEPVAVSVLLKNLGQARINVAHNMAGTTLQTPPQVGWRAHIYGHTIIRIELNPCVACGFQRPGEHRGSCLVVPKGCQGVVKVLLLLIERQPAKGLRSAKIYLTIRNIPPERHDILDVRRRKHGFDVLPLDRDETPLVIFEFAHEHSP